MHCVSRPRSYELITLTAFRSWHSHLRAHVFCGAAFDSGKSSRRLKMQKRKTQDRQSDHGAILIIAPWSDCRDRRGRFGAVWANPCMLTLRTMTTLLTSACEAADVFHVNIIEPTACVDYLLSNDMAVGRAIPCKCCKSAAHTYSSCRTSQLTQCTLPAVDGAATGRVLLTRRQRQLRYRFGHFRWLYPRRLTAWSFLLVFCKY